MTNLYSVSYNVNNATGGITPPTQTASSDSATYTFRVSTADEYGLVKTGYIFMDWSENPTAPIQEYTGGTTIELNSTSPQKTLYAIWGKEYFINFSLGDAGIGSTIPEGKETVTIASFPYTYTPKVTETIGSQANIYKSGYAPNGWKDVTFTADNSNPTTTPVWTNATASNFNTMQDINSTFCNNLNESGRQLFDTRDGKKYWVARLDDGNCWMTQNLDLDLKQGVALTDADSDFTESTVKSWAPSESLDSISKCINKDI